MTCMSTGNRMVLAGDVGGTKTLLGLFDPLQTRPRPIVVREYPTLESTNLGRTIAAFLASQGVSSASVASAGFGVAGPVVGHSATLTNVAWHVDATDIGREFAIRHVALLNDLQAMAYAVPLLQEHELHALQQGEALRGGNAALMAVGTGLGE